MWAAETAKIERSKVVVNSAVQLAENIDANAIVVLTETGAAYDLVVERASKFPIIAATANDDIFQQLVKKTTISTLNIEFLDATKERFVDKTYAVKLMTRGTTRAAQIEDALAVSINKGILMEGDLIVVIASSLDSEANSVFVYEIKRDKLDFALYDLIREINIKQEVFESVLNIAIEIGREGRRGRLIGTAFLIGDSKNVMEKSKQLILNPFEGHIIGERIITNPEIKETIKEIAQLDGAFVITEDGVIVAAGRYLNVDTSSVDIPRGLGTRHAAVAAMSTSTNAVGITVSQSGGIVRIFRKGEVFMTIEPQKKIAIRTEGLKATFTKH